MRLKVPFVEGNPYTTDPVLPGLLKRILPAHVFRDVSQDMERFGSEVLTSQYSNSDAFLPCGYPQGHITTMFCHASSA